MWQIDFWLALLLVMGVVVFVLIKLLKALNSPTGERYLRQQMQGPFIPVTDEPASKADEVKA